MRNVVIVAVYIIGVFLGSALLAPILWKLVFDWSILPFLHEHDDFHRYFNRCLLLLAILGLAILWKILKIQSWRELGWAEIKPNIRYIRNGFFLGIASIALVSALALLLGDKGFNEGISMPQWARHFIMAISGGVIIAVAEETIFRGALFKLLRRDLSITTAAILSALIYSTVHFIDQKPSITEINWLTGIVLFPQFIHDFTNDPYWLATFTNTFLAGLILAGVTERTGNIYFAISVHFGWIISIKTDALATYVTNAFHSHATKTTLTWGVDNITDGWAATPLLTFMTWYILKSRERPADTGNP